MARQAEEDPQANPNLMLFVCDNLGSFYQAKDELEKARRARKRALKIMERAEYCAE
ncbi:hypothetical protein DFAR_1620002 [Desulfarculales bacterium]